MEAARGELDARGADLRELAQLLEAERDAAIRADVDALVELQVSKRETLDRLVARGAGERELSRLSHRARQNVALMRHMLECMRGLVGIDHAGTYAPDGSINRRPGRTRGAL